jgi:hypothetical protein
MAEHKIDSGEHLIVCYPLQLSQVSRLAPPPTYSDHFKQPNSPVATGAQSDNDRLHNVSIDDDIPSRSNSALGRELNSNPHYRQYALIRNPMHTIMMIT